jgi:hypothetical protein
MIMIGRSWCTTAWNRVLFVQHKIQIPDLRFSQKKLHFFSSTFFTMRLIQGSKFGEGERRTHLVKERTRFLVLQSRVDHRKGRKSYSLQPNLSTLFFFGFWDFFMKMKPFCFNDDHKTYIYLKVRIDGIKIGNLYMFVRVLCILWVLYENVWISWIWYELINSWFELYFYVYYDYICLKLWSWGLYGFKLGF